MSVIDCRTGYMRRVYSPDDVLAEFLENVGDDVNKFDTIVGTGLSGALIVPVLARETSKVFAIVRKDNDGSHSGNVVEGQLGDGWIFVDDLVGTGRTRNRVLREIEKLCKYVHHSPEYVGDYLYMGSGQRCWRPGGYQECRFNRSCKCGCDGEYDFF